MKYWFKLFFFWLALRIVFYLPFLTAFKIFWPNLSIKILWRNFDGPYFLAVTDSWYNPHKITSVWTWLNRPANYYSAHFPLYPAIIKFFTYLGFHLPSAGLITNFGFSFIIVYLWVLLYKILYQNRPNPLLALSVLFFPPRMWIVNNIIAPEPLFISLILLTFIFWLRKKYIFALLTASLAFWTKSPAFFLFAALGLNLWLIEKKTNLIKTLKDKRSWLIIFSGIGALLSLNYFYFLKTNNFWAYFQSGDNIHLFWPPLQVFNPAQTWVGSFWLEDVVLILSLATTLLMRSWQTFRQSPLWFYSLLFLSSLFFVAHRDISRYALPVFPILLIMNKDIYKENWQTRLTISVYLILVFFYSWNFINGNWIH